MGSESRGRGGTSGDALSTASPAGTGDASFDRDHLGILVAVVIGSGMVFLDGTVVNVALPRIGEELRSSLFGTLEAQSYVYNAYLLTLSALLIVGGAATDRFGRRRMFLVGLLGFGLTSAMCGAAPTMELLIGARILQGIAGAILVPGSLAIITAAFEGERQGRAFGIWAGASALTTVIGPFLGGVLVDTVSWRLAFLINVPLALVGAWATMRWVPESRNEEADAHLDWVGSTIVALAVGGLAVGTMRGEQSQWQDTSAFVALVVGAAATVALPFYLRRARHPLIPLHLFRSRNFTVTNISTLIIYGGLYVVLYIVSIFLQGTLGYNATAAGIATMPIVILLGLFSSRFGALADRYGPRWFMAGGPAAMGIGILWLVQVPSTSDAWRIGEGSWVPPVDYLVHLFPGLLVFGAGVMIMVAPLTTALMRSVPVQHSGVASAVNNAISRVGPQLVGALVFVAITGVFYGALDARVPSLDTSAAEVRDRFSPLNPPAGEVSSEVAEATRGASTEAFRLAMAVAAGFFFAGAAVNAVGIRNADAEAPEETLDPASEPVPGL